MGPTVRAALEVDSAPDHPDPLAPPLATQDVALVDVQLNTVDCPAWIVDGVAVKEVTAAGGVGAVTVTVAVDGWLTPPVPVHVKVYV